jgi:hypothetical protein
MLDANPTYRTLLAVDIERSAGRGDVALREIRNILETALRQSCTDSGIDWDGCHREDTGDGLRLIAGPEIPKTRFVYPFMGHLALLLRAHNRTAGPATTIRVRAALHAGDVHLSDGRFAGSSLETLARILDAPPLKAALRNAPATVTVALAVSEHIHESVVRHGYVGIDPETYRRVRFTLKEDEFTAWLHLPGGGPVDVSGGRDDDQARRPQPPAADDATGNGVIGIPAGTVIHGGNVAMGNARVRDMIGHIGNRIDHVTGDVHVSGRSAPGGGLREQIAELRRLLAARHRDGQLSDTDFTAADAELRDADGYAATPDEPGSREKLVTALKKVRGLVTDVADLASRVAALISALRGA